MLEERIVVFGPFRLDPDNARLWRGQEALRVSPKALAVLHYLAERAGRLVTKDDLFEAVWSGVVVGDAALTICIGELRKVLGESPKSPQFIETVHKWGYRFIGKVVSSQESGVRSPPSFPAPSPQHPAPALVGRETELRQLRGWLEKAANGQCQIVFVTGEPGIGKTTLIEGFLQSLESKSNHVTLGHSSGKL